MTVRVAGLVASRGAPRAAARVRNFRIGSNPGRLAVPATVLAAVGIRVNCRIAANSELHSARAHLRSEVSRLAALAPAPVVSLTPVPAAARRTKRAAPGSAARA